VLESGLLREDKDRYELDRALPPFAIPTSLRDSLMARLDRLASVCLVAQIGAAMGREFSYALMHTVSRLPEDELQNRGRHGGDDHQPILRRPERVLKTALRPPGRRRGFAEKGKDGG
jgi:hypothetical protein